MAHVDDVYEDYYDKSFDYWTERAAGGDAAKVLVELEGDLTTLYVRMDNDMEGRGEIGDAMIGAQISGIEAVRAELRDKLGLNKKLT